MSDNEEITELIDDRWHEIDEDDDPPDEDGSGGLLSSLKYPYPRGE